MAKQADAFPITSRAIELPAAERARIEAAIQAHLDAANAAIALLDAAEADPDLEENGDAEPDNDGEASLGWTADLNQTRALRSCCDGGEDMEEEHDGREPDVDDEPSLGWTLSGNWGGDDDREVECEDEGACEMARVDLW